MYFAVAGSSGCGKSTIINILIDENEKLTFIPSFTSREPRPGEENGKTYNYISKEEFQKKIANGEMLEYELVHENYYGNSKKIVQEALERGKFIIKDVDVKGVQNLAVKLKDTCPVIKIFFIVPKGVLKKRLVNRYNEGVEAIFNNAEDKSSVMIKQEKEKLVKKNKAELKIRMKRYKLEQSSQDKFDYIIVNENEDKENTLEIMRKIIEIGEDSSKILLTKPLNKLSLKKIDKYVEELRLHNVLSPCKICYKNGNFYVVDGHEKFIASILTNSTLAKKFVNKKEINIITEKEVEEINKFIEKAKLENEKIEEENKDLSLSENLEQLEQKEKIEEIEEDKKAETVETQKEKTVEVKSE